MSSGKCSYYVTKTLWRLEKVATIFTKDGNEWQICYSNIRLHYSNVFEYSDKEIINVYIEISIRRDVRVRFLTHFANAKT